MPSPVDPRSPADPNGPRHFVASDDSFPVLWVFGPPGVGKSTVVWRIFTDLQRSGTVSAYVDIDQLGISYPEPADDPGRHQLQVANLAALIDTYRAAGARCVAVSGVIDPEREVNNDHLRGVTITWCRLRADRAQLTQRLQDRGEVQYSLDDVWRDAELLDRSEVIDALVIDTTNLGLDEVVREVHQRTVGWPGVAAHPEPTGTITRPTLPDYNAAGGAVLWLCGPTGVGKSAVGFQIFTRQLGTGSATAFIDLDQVGFIAPAVIDESIKHQLKAANLAAVWSNYAASGATHLVVVGPAGSRSDLDEYIDALPGATVTVARLHADPEELTRRIMLRSKGQGWAQPGDPILGQSADRLSDIIEAAIADDVASAAANIGDAAIDTTSSSVEDAAEAVLLQTGWPSTAATGNAVKVPE